MVLKTIFMIALYLVPFILILTVFSNPWIVLGMWMLMGFGMAGVGLSIMHDANHGAYSKREWVNKSLGYLINAVGGSDVNWRIQHNVLHHTYTNVHGMDEDINAGAILRFSPHQKRLKAHRLQHIYAWFFYGLQTFARTLATDFTNAKIFRQRGLIRESREYRRIILNIAYGKIFYFIYILAIPIIFAPVPWWLVLVGFGTMHYVLGLMLALIFQSAHVMPECQFPQANESGTIENSWAIHQMQTTTNFSPNNRVFSWFVGGLNFQIEHHLFSNICHTHYREISKIVSSTAEEFGIKYNQQKSFARAIWEHGKMLKTLGRA